MADEEYISMKEAASIAGVTVAAISLAANKGVIGRRIAGHWVFTREEAERYRDMPKSRGGRPKEEAGTLARAVLA